MSRETILFVCQHGGAKSVIAASYFNRLAAKHDLRYVAVAVASEEPSDAVPGPVGEYLQGDGFDVRSFAPRHVQLDDVSAAARVVTMDCRLDGAATVERWDDVPPPSHGVAASATAIRRHVEALADELRKTAPHAPSLAAFVRYFLRLGTFGFGGPIALAGAMQRDLVEERGWVTKDEYVRGLALAQLAPGPLAAQLAIYLGWARAGVLGATLVAVTFVLPSFLMVMAISFAYVRFGGIAWMQSAFYGIGAAVIAIILRSAYKLVLLTLGRDWLLWAVFAVNAIATAVMEAEIVSLILGCGVATLIWRGRDARLSRASAFCLLPSAFGGAPQSATLFWFFVKAGAFVFGSGLAIVPFLYGGVVREHGWLTDQQFLDAVAVAMITPGPVVITVAFIGYLVEGLSGAVLASLGVFLPCYLFVVIPAPFYARFASNPRLKAFVDGVTAGATGAIAGAVYVLARRAIIDIPTILIFAATLASLVWLKRVPEPVVIAIVGIASVVVAAA
jgi:chromate transporter